MKHNSFEDSLKYGAHSRYATFNSFSDNIWIEQRSQSSAYFTGSYSLLLSFSHPDIVWIDFDSMAIFVWYSNDLLLGPHFCVVNVLIGWREGRQRQCATSAHNQPNRTVMKSKSCFIVNVDVARWSMYVSVSFLCVFRFDFRFLFHVNCLPCYCAKIAATFLEKATCCCYWSAMPNQCITNKIPVVIRWLDENTLKACYLFHPKANQLHLDFNFHCLFICLSFLV